MIKEKRMYLGKKDKGEKGRSEEMCNGDSDN